MSATDQITPLDAVDPADWYVGPTPHVRVYQPDQRWRASVNIVTGDASVFNGNALFQRVFLTRGPSGGLMPFSEMSNGRIDMLSYAVAVLYDHAGSLDRDMEELGLSL